MTLPEMLRQQFITALFCMALLITQLIVLSDARGASKSSTSYVIVLASAPGTNLSWKPKANTLFEGRTLFSTRTMLKGAPWERLNLGFFDSRQKAVLALNDIQKLYPGAWLRAATADEIKMASNKALPVPVSDKSASTKKAPANKSTLTDKQLDSLMQRAKTDFKKQDYSQAIRYLTAIISAGEHQYSSEALELLGLSRQRNGQNAHAAAIYKEYLEKYPEGDGTTRVSQRLTGLITSTQAPRDKIHMEEEEGSTSVSYTHLRAHETS